jgi:hypothetical protein
MCPKSLLPLRPWFKIWFSDLRPKIKYKWELIINYILKFNKKLQYRPFTTSIFRTFKDVRVFLRSKIK